MSEWGHITQIYKCMYLIQCIMIVAKLIYGPVLPGQQACQGNIFV